MKKRKRGRLRKHPILEKQQRFFDREKQRETAANNDPKEEYPSETKVPQVIYEAHLRDSSISLEIVREVPVEGKVKIMHNGKEQWI